MGAYPGRVPPDATNPPPELPEQGLKVALVINIGSDRADMYGFQPRKAYNLKYGTANGKAAYAYTPIGEAKGDTARSEVIMCPRRDHRHAEHLADFRNCNAPIAVAPKTASILGALFSLLRFGDSAARPDQRTEDPAWWSCGSGCCTAKAVYPK
jgi:hypothetical protein